MSALSPRSRLKSISYALAGISALVRTQANARIHAAATIVVVAAGFWAHLAAWEWCSIIFAIAIVWTAEALNTAFEFVCDAVSREFNPSIRLAKDIAAGGVLLSAMSAACVGLIVFLPHIQAF